MNVLLKEERAELVIKNSRFISEALIVESQASARERLRAQKERYADASHVCHAFVVGENAEVCGMGDDGEPGGTAGRPMLDVLKGSGITNILVTVTRYFGGTLLGTGGLVRAYGDSVKAVLALCKTEALVKKISLEFSVPYDTYKNLKRLFQDFHISKLTEDFSTQVNVRASLYQSEKDAFAQHICNATRGKTTVHFLEET